ncbi:thiolase family protein [Rhizobium sp. BK456]|uniref:thiolase family protein n=1 Tax=Rhizobium sp. BK456 TaxID=2587007 RepID=UPI001617E9A5|nr:thiolase family protein [Rhizobium sp. BK456]MBB3526996.1 acetyl-CoA acetyltransferase [Rhizobium sp. BK456]
MTEAYIAGIGMTPLGKHWDQSVKQLSARAIDVALADAGIGPDAIEAAWFCNTRLGVLEGQHNIRGQTVLRAYGFENIPIFNTDNACASSSSGLAQAWAAVRSGIHDVVLVVGAEKMNFRDKEQQMFDAFKGSWDRELADQQMQALLAIGEDLPLPEKALNQTGQRSVFMDIYSAMARYHMHRFGTTEEQIAKVAAKNHWHSQWNELAQYRTPMDPEEVLADKLISYPMTRAMCAPMSDGAAALVVVSERAMQRFDRKRAVGIRAVSVSSGSNRKPDELDKHLTRTAANRAYALAGLGPSDVSVAELHDATAFAEIMQSEHCGFAPYGEGGPLAESGATRLGGRIPINVSGGLLSKGHPIGATGAIQVNEIVMQLRGEAGKRQVEGARIGLCENGGGFYGFEEAACVVSLFEAPSRD